MQRHHRFAIASVVLALGGVLPFEALPLIREAARRLGLPADVIIEVNEVRPDAFV